jgi:hypothetical protein
MHVWRLKHCQSTDRAIVNSSAVKNGVQGGEQVFMVPASTQPLILDADFERTFLLEQVECNMAQGSKVDGSVVLA